MTDMKTSQRKDVVTGGRKGKISKMIVSLKVWKLGEIVLFKYGTSHLGGKEMILLKKRMLEHS